MSELSLVEKCLGTSVHILDLTCHFTEFLFKGFIKKLRVKLLLITMPIDLLSLNILNMLGSHVSYRVSIELCHGILLTCC